MSGPHRARRTGPNSKAAQALSLNERVLVAVVRALRTAGALTDAEISVRVFAAVPEAGLSDVRRAITFLVGHEHLRVLPKRFELQPIPLP